MTTKTLVNSNDTFDYWRVHTNTAINNIGDLSVKKANTSDVFTDHEFLVPHVTVLALPFTAAASGDATLSVVSTEAHKLRVGMNVVAKVSGVVVSDENCIVSGITYNSGGADLVFDPAFSFSPTPATVDVDFYTNVTSYLNELELGKMDRHGDTMMGTLKINHKDAAGVVGTLSTDEAIFNLINTNATTVNIAGAGTTISIGAGTGVTTINNLLDVNEILVDQVSIKTNTVLTSFSATVATTSPTALFSVDATVYRSLEVLIQSKQGSDYSLTKLLVIHDGTDSIETEYGSLSVAPGTYDSFLSGGTLAIRVTQGAATSTDYKIQVTALKV